MVPAKGHKYPELLADGFPAFSSKSVCALNLLLSEFDATIILTTSHKYRFSLEYWKQLLATEVFR